MMATTWFALFAIAFSQPMPSIQLSPGEVIRTVAAALQNNDSPLRNAGVFTAYQFASPGNREVTGPYGRFLRIVRSEDSRPLFGIYPEEFGPLTVNGSEAQQDLRVQTPAGPVNFRFTLSRQKAGPCPGCWMIDGVVRVR